MIQDDIINHVEYFKVTIIYTVSGQRKENKPAAIRIVCIHNNNYIVLTLHARFDNTPSNILYKYILFLINAIV